MQMEHLILIAMWLLGIVGFIVFIPRKDVRMGLLSLLIYQSVIFNCDMFAFKYDLLSAPIRIFPKATHLAITINYIFYPVLFSIFYVHKRVNSSLGSRLTYFFIWISIITVFDNVIEIYTDLLEYGILTWYGMWIYIAFLFYISQVLCNWFFQGKSLFQPARWRV